MAPKANATDFNVMDAKGHENLQDQGFFPHLTHNTGLLDTQKIHEVDLEIGRARDRGLIPPLTGFF